MPSYFWCANGPRAPSGRYLSLQDLRPDAGTPAAPRPSGSIRAPRLQPARLPLLRLAGTARAAPSLSPLGAARRGARRRHGGSPRAGEGWAGGPEGGRAGRWVWAGSGQLPSTLQPGAAYQLVADLGVAGLSKSQILCSRGNSGLAGRSWERARGAEGGERQRRGPRARAAAMHVRGLGAGRPGSPQPRTALRLAGRRRCKAPARAQWVPLGRAPRWIRPWVGLNAAGRWV